MRLTSSISLFFVFLPAAISQTPANLLQNNAFLAAPVSGMAYWTPNAGANGLGTFSVTPGTTGGTLRLAPNSKNPASAWLGASYGFSQGLAASALKASAVYISAWMGADAGSVSTLRVTSLWADGHQTFQEIRQGPVASPMLRRDVMAIPSRVGLMALVVTCGVEGTTGAAYFKNVSLSDGVPSTWLEARGIPDTGNPYEATIVVDATRLIRHIPSTLFGSNLEWPWDGSGIWDVQRTGPNADAVSLTKVAGITMHRFPGGVYADFYDWRKGVGPQASRPLAVPLPKGVATSNNFGTDEALQFAQATNAEILITVNIVTDTPQGAADWVRYTNAAGTKVKYWEIGNESYASGPSGDLTPDQYAARFLLFAQAMRAVDPNIKIGAIADEQYTHSTAPLHPGWTDRVLTLAGQQIDFVAVHCGYAPVIFDDKGWDARTVYAAQLAAPKLIADQLASLSARIARLVPDRAANIDVAVTEWGPLFQMDPNTRFVDHPKTLASALFTASALKSFIESPRTDVANFFKLVDITFQGSIGFRQGMLAAKSSLFAIQMYRKYSGSELLSSQVTSPTYDSPTVGWVDSVSNVPYLDAITTSTPDGKKLFVMAINKHLDRAIHTRLSLANFVPLGSAVVYTLNGLAADSNTDTDLQSATGVTWAQQAQVLPNSRFYTSTPTDVGIVQTSLSGLAAAFEYTFPAHSVTVIAIDSK